MAPACLVLKAVVQGKRNEEITKDTVGAGCKENDDDQGLATRDFAIRNRL